VVVPRHDMMENMKKKPLTSKEVTRVNNVVCETLKHYVAALEDANNDLDGDKFYMP